MPTERPTTRVDPPANLLYDMMITIRAERRAKWYTRIRAMLDVYVAMGATAGLIALVIVICKLR